MEDDDLRSLLPPEIARLPEEEQNKYLDHIIELYRQDEERHAASQRIEAEFRANVAEYAPLHPHLRAWSDEFVCEELRAALSSSDESQIRNLLTPLSTDVYSFPMFTKVFCAELLEEIDNFEAWAKSRNIPVPRPNSMNNFGVLLNLMGHKEFFDEFVSRIATPFAALLFPEVGGKTIDSHHTFIVEYGEDKDKGLGFHVDDSEVTLNVALSESFVGGSLYFKGRRCVNHQQVAPTAKEEVQVEHVATRAIIHTGRHRHGANNLVSGRRSNLIVWCRSSEYRNDVDYRLCPEWCGCHNSDDNDDNASHNHNHSQNHKHSHTCGCPH